MGYEELVHLDGVLAKRFDVVASTENPKTLVFYLECEGFRMLHDLSRAEVVKLVRGLQAWLEESL